MKQYSFFQQDFGAPPPPPPPSMSTPPPPPPSGGAGTGMSAGTNAIIALVAGILSYVMCPFILGIVAWIMGKGELGKIDRGESSEAGRTMAKIGMWLGIINVILCILFGLVYLLIILLAIVTSN
ncbi:MAG: DUF4190 domain-containing protein [Chlorobi bacterium]|nr:DUF4190 domain-containing protein [Chlorobiota bacterium]MCI0715575.1 DUF4190 domain-containing protein [Chlorobiota bacterium]